jgi:CDP-glucose 4,6-dehydratase
MLENRILLTGASGFTGFRLAEYLLDAGAVVTVLLIEGELESKHIRDGLFRQARRVHGSILDFDLLVRTIADHRIDTVFHLASVAVQGAAYQRPMDSFEVNIRGTYNILESCRRNAGLVERVIVASSDKVYGDNPPPYDESMPVEGMNPYDVSKSCADLLARSYHHSFDLPVAVARFANIYGGGDLHWSRVVPNTIRRLLQGKPPLLRVPQSGVYKRDFLYIKDLVRAYMALFHAMKTREIWGQAYNFGTGDCIPVADVVAKIQRLLGLDHIAPSIASSDNQEILHQQLLSDKAREELGWVPEYSLDEGLAETIEWYRQYFARQHPTQPLKEPSSGEFTAISPICLPE